MRRPQRRTPSRGLFPPAPTWPHNEAALLEEAEGALALLLWQRARDVRLWALASGTREGLFAGQEGVEHALEAARGTPDAISVPLRALGAMVRYPEHVTAPSMSTSCLAVSEWAEAEHMPETALHFAEVAALADPMSARAAAVAGALCTAQAADQRAEVWLTRAIRTARRTKDWEWYVRGHLRLGLLFYELGDVPRARRAHHRARSSAHWSGFYSYAGTAAHNLMLIETTAGTFEAGERHAREALGLYPIHHPRLPHLAHDVGCLLACHGAFRDALTVLDAASPLFSRAWERVALLGTVALAAAGTGQRERHTEAVADLLLLTSAAETHAAGALSLAAEGAELLGDGERAHRLAARALELAEPRREREPMRRARRVLEGAGPQRIPPPPPERTSALRTLFVKRLRELREPAAAPVKHTELVQSTFTSRP